MLAKKLESHRKSALSPPQLLCNFLANMQKLKMHGWAHCACNVQYVYQDGTEFHKIFKIIKTWLFNHYSIEYIFSRTVSVLSPYVHVLVQWTNKMVILSIIVNWFSKLYWICTWMLLFLLLIIINIKFKFVHETNKEKSTEILPPLLLTYLKCHVNKP